MESVFSRENQQSDKAESIKKGVHLMVVAMKNLALYPITSQANRQTIAQLLAWFQEFFAQNANLTLYVSKDQLISEEEEVVYHEKASESIVCGPMFRDGVQSIIFENGLNEEELKGFLLILNRFRNPSDDEGDDLVTAMWQASYPNIKYQVADEYAEVDPEFDTAAMRAARARLDQDDFDSGWDALAPLEVEGMAPVSKSLGSLFALAADPNILTNSFGRGPGGGTGGDAPDGWSGGTSGEPGAPDLSGGSGSGGLGSNPGGSGSGGPGSNPGGSGPNPNGPGANQGQPNYGPGGDIDDHRTDYVEADVSNISQTIGDLDLSSFKSTSHSGALKSWAEEETDKAERRLNYWGLTDEEAENLAALVKWDESLDTGYQALDILMTLIVSPVMTPVVGTFINRYLVEEARRSLLSLDLKNFNYFLDIMRREGESTQDPTILAVLENLKIAMSQPEILEPLFSTKHPPEKIEANYDDLRYFLYQLPLGGINSLALGVGKVQDAKLKNLVLEVVAYAYAAASSNENFGPILATLNEAAIVLLLRHLVAPGRPFPAHILLTLTKHNSATVRSTAAQAMLERDPSLMPQIAYLATDPLVTATLRPFLLKKRDATVEKYLLNYLRSLAADSKNQPDVKALECYQTLGVTASPPSIAFLSEVLLKSSWKNIVSRSLDLNRVGAAMALFLAQNDSEAAEALRKASRSAFRNIRNAYKEAERRLAVN
ncbi:MAG: hypothetical protein LBS60_06030 [Deltaproteobacteria bacterium]|jgi:hypothetical protein|nr:hypothetical protein [Deltaproteobacteria bacterium]